MSENSSSDKIKTFHTEEEGRELLAERRRIASELQAIERQLFTPLRDHWIAAICNQRYLKFTAADYQDIRAAADFGLVIAEKERKPHFAYMQWLAFAEDEVNEAIRAEVKRIWDRGRVGAHGAADRYIRSHLGVINQFRADPESAIEAVMSAAEVKRRATAKAALERAAAVFSPLKEEHGAIDFEGEPICRPSA